MILCADETSRSLTRSCEGGGAAGCTEAERVRSLGPTELRELAAEARAGAALRLRIAEMLARLELEMGEP